MYETNSINDTGLILFNINNVYNLTKTLIFFRK